MAKTNAEVDITYFLPCSPTTRNFSLFFYHGFFFHTKFKINRTEGERGRANSNSSLPSKPLKSLEKNIKNYL